MVIYKNIYIEDRYNDEPTVHLWDSEKGHIEFEYTKKNYVRSPDGQYTSLFGDSLAEVPASKIDYNTKQRLQERYGEGNAIFQSDLRLETQILSEVYRDAEEPSDEVETLFFDIEVSMEGELPNVDTANNPITSIAYNVASTDESKVLIWDPGGETDNFETDGVEVVPFEEEDQLLYTFVEQWRDVDPDIVSGWNCIPTDSHIWMENGIAEISELESNTKLYNYGSVERIYPRSFKEKWVMSLADGTLIQSSKDHVFPVIMKESEDYSVLSERSSTCQSSELTVEEIEEEDKDIFVKKELGNNTNSDYRNITVEDAYALGMIYTDGCISKNTISVYNNNIHVIKELNDYFSQFKKIDRGGNGIYEDERHENTTYRIRSHRTDYNRLNQNLDLVYNGEEKQLNVKELSRLSEEQFFAFLSGYIDGDGSVLKDGRIQLYNYNGETDKILELLNWNGIWAESRKGKTISISPDQYNLLKLRKHNFLKSKDKRNRLNSIEGFERKNESSDNIRIRRFEDKVFVRITDVENTGEEVEMIDIKTSSGYFDCFGIKTHNCDHFDIPYLYRRISRVINSDFADKLSPIEEVEYLKGRDRFIIAGVNALDYLSLYKNFTFTELDSYSLDNVSKEELDRGKVEYLGREVETEDGETTVINDLDDLREYDLEAFVEYNMKDVWLVRDLDRKFDYIELARKICHLGHVPYEDIYMSSRYIDGAIITRLNKRDIIAPNVQRIADFELDGFHSVGSKKIKLKNEIHPDIPREGTLGIRVSSATKKKVDYKRVEGKKFILEKPIDFEVYEDYSIGLEFEGAYVKEPDPGLYEWIYDLDLTSMYPSIIMSINISPETLVGKIYDWSAEEFIKEDDKTYKVWIFDKEEFTEFTIGELEKFLEEGEFSVAANGAFYKNDKKGIIPEILEEWFTLRQEYKSIRNEWREKEGEEAEEKAEYYDKLQHVHKILINSVYGIMGLPTFRFYNIYNAAAVTMTGQALIKYTQRMGDHYYNRKIGKDVGFEDGSEMNVDISDTYKVMRDGEKMKVKGKELQEGDELIIEE